MTGQLTWLGHSTVVLELGSTRLLTDPLLFPNAVGLRRRGPAPQPEAWAGAAATLISHLHQDHAELRSVRKTGAPVLTGARNAAYFERRGVSATGLDEDHWYSIAGTPVQVRLTRAVHGHRPMPHRPNQAHGHLIRAGGVTVWVAGDTSLYPELESLSDLVGGIDVAVVPVGGWGPRLSGGHLGPADAARACHLVGASVAVPYHWGTLHAPGMAGTWMDAAGPQFVTELERHVPRCRPALLSPGGQLTL